MLFSARAFKTTVKIVVSQMMQFLFVATIITAFATRKSSATMTTMTTTMKMSIVSSNPANVLIFGPHNMRLHDNPLLNSSPNCPSLPVFLYDIDTIHGITTHVSTVDACLQNLKDNFARLGGNLTVLGSGSGIGGEEDSIQSLLAYIRQLHSTYNITVVYTASPVEPMCSYLSRLQSALEAEGVSTYRLTDQLVVLPTKAQPQPPGQMSFASKEIKRAYAQLEDNEPMSVDPSRTTTLNLAKEAKVSLSDAVLLEHTASQSTDRLAGESLALELVRCYAELGDKEFSRRFHLPYIRAARQEGTLEHALSLARLVISPKLASYESILGLVDQAVRSPGLRPADEDGYYTANYFDGEVLSALLAPLVALGCLSPRLLASARRDEAVRKDWHLQLAASLPSTAGAAGHSSWQISFRYWRGYLQREARWGRGPLPGAATQPKPKPIAFLVHGFGGSVDQFTGLAEKLGDEYEVYAIDSLGFGQSEKPPLSYNQYLWRDQVVDFVAKTIAGLGGSDEEQKQTPFFIAGNSIGGFTAAAAMALLEHERGYCNGGLVLINSAGRILDGGGLSNTPQPELFKPYSGPSSFLLNIFGRVIFSLLQPQIKRTCEWLYPTNPQAVSKRSLDKNILRDSNDPGASVVIAAGGKLPTPRPMNDLLREFSGSVLIAQGALDPLNDARARAKSFARIRSGVNLDLLELGHCPMDEEPFLVAGAISKWLDKYERKSQSFINTDNM